MRRRRLAAARSCAVPDCRSRDRPGPRSPEASCPEKSCASSAFAEVLCAGRADSASPGFPCDGFPCPFKAPLGCPCELPRAFAAPLVTCLVTYLVYGLARALSTFDPQPPLGPSCSLAPHPRVCTLICGLASQIAPKVPVKSRLRCQSVSFRWAFETNTLLQLLQKIVWEIVWRSKRLDDASTAPKSVRRGFVFRTLENYRASERWLNVARS